MTTTVANPATITTWSVLATILTFIFIYLFMVSALCRKGSLA